ncbi:MAG TPA: RHS repeat-associated core domain-containing protein [Terriglobales bacterium]|nr:RHS repeat-associated core domain-containing protein [Terriglobales bacterium]
MTPAEPPRYADARSPAAAGRRGLILLTFRCGFLLAFAAPRVCAQYVDDHNPVGVAGTFEGVVTTGCGYNVLNHSTSRAIDDIVVPGSIGKYPLKMTRYHASAGIPDSALGPGWRHEYAWFAGQGKVEYPNGNIWDNYCENPVGVSDWPVPPGQYTNGAFRLADGGTIVWAPFGTGQRVSRIIDPYGQQTTITYASNGTWMTVTEPGRRYLYFIFTALSQNSGLFLTRVEAHGLGNGTVTDWVNYHYDQKLPGGSGTLKWCLTRVDYADSNPNNLNDDTHAHYTYEQDNVPDQPTRGSSKFWPLVSTCHDPRYKGPMRRIAYDYQGNGPHGAITAERYSASDGNKGLTVSSIPGNLPSPLSGGPVFQMPTNFTETRGDGPTRTFNYTWLHVHRDPENGACPTLAGPAPSQFLLNYTDFRGHTTQVGYDSNWYVNSVTDANNHTTRYTRGPNIGEITQIMHPDSTHIDYVYENESPNISGHYVHSVSDERQNVITYTRDPTTHLVTRIDYPQDANTPASSEGFTYNGFGQVLMHQLKNGAWESFVYNNRGLLTDKYNPKATQPSGGDPHTHYTYYTSGPWTDRVMTMTVPGNYPNNLQASETYEYDRALGADGTTDPTGTPVAGRGLVTKITHGDNTYQSFGYDGYGNKRWEENELRQRTSYTYDEYNRLLSATNPLYKTTTYDYSPTEGDTTRCRQHTSNSPYWVTTPARIKTRNLYDGNFRKTYVTAAYGTLNLTTAFAYDNVGNLTDVTDPLTHVTHDTYDSRNRKTSSTEAYGTTLARTTGWHYDPASNIYQIDRPDTTSETKVYDALNRMTWDIVPKTNSLNLVTYFNYNPSGTLAWMSDPNGHYTSFYYDASDQRIEMIYHDGSIQWWGYDDAHNLEYRITVNGEWQLFSYDIRNHKYANWWSNWNDSVRNPDWCYFAYDPAGRLTEALNGTNGWGANIISDVHRSYDAAGHLTLDQQIVTDLGTLNVNYPTYDDDGRLTRLYVSGVSGYDFTYSYDAMGRFEKIFITNSSQLFQYHYDAASNETERDNVYNGVNQFYPPDALNRMQYMDVKKGATTLAHEGYTYDTMNRITAVSYQTGPADSFSYYLDGELKQATLGNLEHILTYNLDQMGNRTSVVDNNVTSTYSPNPINQYTSVTGSSISNGSEHEISAFNGVTYGYINDERLRSAASGSITYSMAYDALGRCVKRSLSNGPTTYYIYDGEKPILEYGTGAVSVGTNVYGKGIDEILERVAVGSDGQWHTYFPQQNHEGSVTLLTDPSGVVLERYRYDAFGAPSIYTPTWTTRSATIYDNRFLFTGREYAATYRSTYTNSAFNFYEYRARAYNPKLGRFMSEDPKLFDAGDYNLFRYCHNDPIDFTDPMGLDTMANAMAVAEAVVPGQYEYNQMVANFHAGNYGTAAGWAGTMLVSQYAGIVSGTSSTRAQASFRAARIAMAERQAAMSATARTFSSSSAAKSGLATRAHEAVFWSGIGKGGPERAATWAAQNGGATLESTLASRGITLPAWNASNPTTVAAWRQAGIEFAAGARGNVRVLQTDALRVDAIWRAEFRALQANPNVNSIRAINPNTGRDVLLWSR